ncbi:MAG: IS200/IS605 family accessory protein TnpB-related protein [Candidatus Hermodarchaeota archaeon]|nr:IS200/IS605 family accessory protein TnpB-related protein [Candidatus Hermodarchaeota archaeon]
MALDINSGHVDFAILDDNLQLIQLGRINCFTLLFASAKKRAHYLFKFVNLITRIAQHFDAMVIVGKLNTGRFRSRNRHANRRIKQMPQYNLRQILKYKLLLEGIPVEERSEAYTSKIGKDLAALIGVDTHKAAAILFALKFLDYPKFMTLRSSTQDEKHLPLRVQAYNEGNGSRSTTELRVGSGLTVLSKTYRLGYYDTTDGGGYPAIPSSWGLSNFAESLKPNLVQRIVKIVLD